MNGPLDRIRRILSDHGSEVRRASEMPARPPLAAESVSAPAESRNRSALFERLRALQAETPRRGAPARVGSLQPMPALEDFEDDDERTLKERVGAVVRSGAKGSFLQVERRFALAERHGHHPFAHAFERPAPLRRRERRPGGRASLDLRDAVFLDIETTGLSGGTGTLAFLVGTARVEGDGLVLRQYFVRDFPDEPAVLEAIADDLGDAPLVTFNGRSFDAPLLSTRFRLHRIPFADRDHLDLLPPSRRLWAGSLDSHALGNLERTVLGIARTRDLPGSLMPAAYFAWLREGRGAALSLAFAHNETDVLSMVSLAGVVSRIVDDPTSRPSAPPRDHLDTARLLIDLGDAGRARRCLEAAAVGDDVPAPVRRLLAALQRRDGDFAAALATWTAWLERAGPFDAHPYEETAKHLEHRARDLPSALTLVEQALARCPDGDPRRPALKTRAARLRRRIGTAAARAATRA